MDAKDLVAAIRYLKPTAEFSFNEADYSTIKWDVLEGDAPTWPEIQAAREAVKEAEAQAEAVIQANREAALSKLAALGLTADDLKALEL